MTKYHQEHYWSTKQCLYPAEKVVRGGGLLLEFWKDAWLQPPSKSEVCSPHTESAYEGHWHGKIQELACRGSCSSQQLLCLALHVMVELQHLDTIKSNILFCVEITLKLKQRGSSEQQTTFQFKPSPPWIWLLLILTKHVEKCLLVMWFVTCEHVFFNQPL